MSGAPHTSGGVASATPKLSGFWPRVGALLIDLTICYSPYIALGWIVAGPAGWSVTEAADRGPALPLVLLGLMLATAWAYFGVMEGVRGQTVGKLAFAIRVVDSRDHAPIGVPRALLRLPAKLGLAMVWYLAFLWMIWDADKQTWHDKLVSSVVVSSVGGVPPKPRDRPGVPARNWVLVAVVAIAVAVWAVAILPQTVTALQADWETVRDSLEAQEPCAAPSTPGPESTLQRVELSCEVPN